LLKQDRQLWGVMSELVLRTPRDADLAHTFRQMDHYWHTTLRDLIAAAVADGAIAPQLTPDDAAALIIVAIRGLSLPTVGGTQTRVADQVFALFERLLGLTSGTPTRSRKRSTPNAKE